MHTYIIAEAGVNHNGQLDLALKLCDAAKKAGVDCVKFQTWQTEKIVTRKVEKATHQCRRKSVRYAQETGTLIREFSNSSGSL